jgi:sulfatase modifying factor 1
MVLVHGGSFTMGERAIAEPVHKVTVSGFLIGRTEVTQGQYQAVVGENPAEFTGDAARPVERVSWLDAATFCNKLSLLEGLRPCYTISRASVTCDFSKNGYRLPTEAEWEYAARGGLAGRGYAFAGSNIADEVAWYYGDSGNRSMPVATKLPNELGIYDMSGSLWEWCWDWYGPYPATEQVDARGPASGQRRVMRGGSWNDGDSTLRCAHRNSASPDTWDNTRVGFRVVRRVD